MFRLYIRRVLQKDKTVEETIPYAKMVTIRMRRILIAFYTYNSRNA